MGATLMSMDVVLKNLITCRVCDVFLQNRHINPGEQGARCFPIIGEKSPYQSQLEKYFNVDLNEEAESFDSPVLDEIYRWHTEGEAPSIISRDGRVCIYVQFAFQFPSNRNQGWRNDCIALDLDIDKGTRDLNYERMKKVHILFQELDIEYYWNFSRSYGLHLWIPFELPIQQSLSFQVACILKNKLIENGIVDEDQAKKIETRPLKVVSVSSNETSRLSLPNNSIYSHMILMSGRDIDQEISPSFSLVKNPTSIVDVILKMGLKERPIKNKSTKKSSAVSYEEIREEALRKAAANYRKAYGAKEEWKKIDVEIPYGWSAPEEIKDIEIFSLPSCVQFKIYSGIKITEGWNNELYNIALSLWAIYGLDTNPEELLDKHTRLMNFLDGEGRPQDQGFYRTHFDSARRKLEGGGTSLTCQETPSMCEYCDSVRCARVKGGYNAVRGVLQDSGMDREGLIYRVHYLDPLVSSGQTHIFPKAWLKPEYHFDSDQAVNGLLRNAVITMSSSEMHRSERFIEAFARNPNSSVYDYIKPIQDIPSKQFYQIILEYMSNKILVIDDAMYEGTFCRNLGKMLILNHIAESNLSLLSQQGIQVGVVTGIQCVFISSKIVSGALSRTIRRYPQGTESFYMKKVLDAEKIEQGWCVKYSILREKVIPPGIDERYKARFSALLRSSKNISNLHR